MLASFILMVLIASVQAFGFKVGGLFTSNAAATSRIVSWPLINNRTLARKPPDPTNRRSKSQGEPDPTNAQTRNPS